MSHLDTLCSQFYEEMHRLTSLEDDVVVNKQFERSLESINNQIKEFIIKF